MIGLNLNKATYLILIILFIGSCYGLVTNFYETKQMTFLYKVKNEVKSRDNLNSNFFEIQLDDREETLLIDVSSDDYYDYVDAIGGGFIKEVIDEYEFSKSYDRHYHGKLLIDNQTFNELKQKEANGVMYGVIMGIVFFGLLIKLLLEF